MSRKAEDLRRVVDRLHILDGVVRGLERWDDISAAVAGTENRRAAAEVLQSDPFGFSDLQAQHVLDMPMGRRTMEGRQSIIDEVGRVRAILEELESQPPDGPGVDPSPKRRRSRGNTFYRTEATMAGGTVLKLCRQRYGGLAGSWGFAIYRASHDDYQDSFLPSGIMGGSPYEALDCACGLYVNHPSTWLDDSPTN